LGGATAVSISGTQTLTNKTISGANNTLSNIANASLTNSSITFGSTAQALGSTVSALNGVSIGASSASTGAFTNLAYTGTLTGGTSVINIGSGQLYKDASGNVGIGTTDPTSGGTNALAKDLVISRGTGVCGMNLIGSENRIWFSSNSALAQGFLIYNQASNFLGFGTNNTERMRINSAGNVGIGTSAPTDRLEVAGVAVAGSATGGTTGSLVLRSRETSDITRLSIGTLRSSGATYIGRLVEPSTTVADGFNGGATSTAAASAWVLDGDGSTRFESFPSGAMTKGSAIAMLERMRITSAGNVGIGTSSPNVGSATADNRVLTLTGQTEATSGIFELQNPGTTTAGRSLGLIRFFNGTNENSRIESRVEGAVNDDGRLAFFTRATGGSLAERMRITSAGNVGIGTSSPVRPLVIRTGVSVSSVIKLANADSGETLTDGFDLAFDGSNGYLNLRESGFLSISTNNTERMRIDSSGNLLVGTTAAPANVGVNAKMRIQDAFQYGTTNNLGGIQAFALSQPATKTFTITGGGNGSKSHLEFKAIAWNGYKQCVFTIINNAGIWQVTEYVVGSGGSVPTVTITNNNTATVTIVVDVSTGFNGGYLIGTIGSGFITMS
jgi:hypothetical protein